MTSKEFCDYAYSYLLKTKPEGLSEEELNSFLNDTDFHPKSLNDIFEALAVALQDSSYMAGPINYPKNKEFINKILCGLDAKKVLAKYPNPEDLYKELSFILPTKVPNGRRVSVHHYAEYILSAAAFLSKFDDYDAFQAFLKDFTKNEYLIEALPMILSGEIKGLGFALACDFLKEIGNVNYIKPDSQLIEVFFNLGLCKDNQISCFKAGVKMALEAGITPYRLDKMVWLICSGNYYRFNLRGKRLKKDFIVEVRSRFKLES